LHAAHEPSSLSEWERWLNVTRKAVRKKAITAHQVTAGTPDDPGKFQLVHAYCQRRRTAVSVSLPV
jgi:hypothetical protein